MTTTKLDKKTTKKSHSVNDDVKEYLEPQEQKGKLDSTKAVLLYHFLQYMEHSAIMQNMLTDIASDVVEEAELKKMVHDKERFILGFSELGRIKYSDINFNKFTLTKSFNNETRGAAPYEICVTEDGGYTVSNTLRLDYLLSISYAYSRKYLDADTDDAIKKGETPHQFVQRFMTKKIMEYCKENPDVCKSNHGCDISEVLIHHLLYIGRIKYFTRLYDEMIEKLYHVDATTKFDEFEYEAQEMKKKAMSFIENELKKATDMGTFGKFEAPDIIYPNIS